MTSVSASESFLGAPPGPDQQLIATPEARDVLRETNMRGVRQFPFDWTPLLYLDWPEVN